MKDPKKKGLGRGLSALFGDQKEEPNKVSGLVVKHLISSIGFPVSILNFTSHPKDFPIQFFCIILTLFGHSSNELRLSKSSSAKCVILKNH